MKKLDLNTTITDVCVYRQSAEITRQATLPPDISGEVDVHISDLLFAFRLWLSHLFLLQTILYQYHLLPKPATASTVVLATTAPQHRSDRPLGTVRRAFGDARDAGRHWRRPNCEIARLHGFDGRQY